MTLYGSIKRPHQYNRKDIDTAAIRTLSAAESAAYGWSECFCETKERKGFWAKREST